MAEPFKNWFHEGVVREYADALDHVDGFDGAAFASEVLDGFGAKELKDRVHAIADGFHAHLSGHFPADIVTLQSLLGPPADPHKTNQFQMTAWPIASYIERHGAGHFDEAMAAMHAVTQRFSCEFAVRPFLVAEPERALAMLLTWTQDPSPNVRRLVSEGTRPLLPWAMRLHAFVADPSPVLPLLEALRDDDALYVRKSVANHLNDISKHHPEVVRETIGRWLKASPTANVQWIARQGLRTLVKQGDPEAMRLLGFDPDAPVGLADLTVSARVVEGEALEVSFTAVNEGTTPTPVVVDYVLHMVKANGSLSPKVFKGSTFTLKPGARRTVTKKIALKRVTTRRHFSGTHHVDVQINGKKREGRPFELVVPEP